MVSLVIGSIYGLEFLGGATFTRGGAVAPVPSSFPAIPPSSGSPLSGHRPTSWMAHGYLGHAFGPAGSSGPKLRRPTKIRSEHTAALQHSRHAQH
jgi:hypothetical protein